MLRTILLGLSFLLCLSVSAQDALNMTMLGQFDDNSLPIQSGVAYNDIWGYAVGGREYAIVGSLRRVHFFEVTDPSNIDEIASFQAPIGNSNSIWRDIKTFGNYAYAVSDAASEGLMIFDLCNINGTGSNRVTLQGQLRDDFTTAHNLYIDESHGIMYLVGGNVPGNMLIYELNTDPANPTYVDDVTFTAGYIHDVYVENHRAYCSHLTQGLRIYDMSPVTDSGENPPGSPVELGVLNTYPYQIFNHSSWVSGDIIIFADERNGNPLQIADISVLNDAQYLDDFYSNLLGVANPYSSTSPRGPIAHNPFILGNYCIASYYHDGVSIFDISDPTDVVQVGYYDTEPNNTNYNGFDGCWGVYPFLPSGNIIASDVLNGLFVLDFNIVLPVEWESFTANAEKGGVRLDWSTSRQEQNRGFSIERQGPNNSWIDIGWEPADESQRYRFWDTKPSAGWNVYRLVQRDFDGKTSNSELRSVYVEAEEQDWQVFPNPAPAGSLLSLNSGASSLTNWQILDNKGVEVWRAAIMETLDGANLQLPNLPSGIYYLSPDGSAEAIRLVIE